MTSPPELGTLLGTLDRHGVAFVVAGSVAAMAHGVPDVDPGDLDIVPATDPDNLDRLRSALASLAGAPAPEYGAWRVDEMGEREWVEDGRLRPARPLDATDPTTFDHSFTTRHGTLDVVPEAAGAYEALRPRASRLAIAGSSAWVAHPLDLLSASTRPRRTKDVPRVRHLRAAASTSGVGFVGFRTARFDEMVALFRDRIGLEVVREAPGATWFRLGTDAELHVYAETDPDHAFFTTGPVVGIRVADVDATRHVLEADGLAMLTEIERTQSAAWCHFRAPDGTILEIIGPA